MANSDIIIMSNKESARLNIIHKVIERLITQKEAGDILDISIRQVRRLTKRVRKEGNSGISHKSRGRPSNRTIANESKDIIIELYRNKYKGFGPTLASEKLLELEGIKISDETLRQWLIAVGEWKKRRKGRQHRQWRERKHCLGEMIQIDGSHHAWFEDRGPKCVLMGYIDDATNRVFAGFYEYEGTIPAMDSFKRYIKKYGLPCSVYLDKHTTYKSNAKPTIDDELNDQEPLSQFGRVLKELGVNIIYANSPQAKGRIERLFRTFQDRLIKEMRIRGIKSIEDGNKFLDYYLPIYNERFGVQAVKKVDLHRALPKGLKLDNILCIKTKRALRNDFTVVHECKLYQVIEQTKAKEVIIEERIDGVMLIKVKDKSISYKEITERPVRAKEPYKGYKPSSSKAHVPSADNPWRKFKINPKKQTKQKGELLKV